MNKIYRQGDVVIRKVDKIKGKTQKVKSLVLAEGEITGHLHELRGRTRNKQILCSESEGRKYFEIEQSSMLTHPEHNTLKIPEGKYEYVLQREVDLLGEVRNVMD